MAEIVNLRASRKPKARRALDGLRLEREEG